ncbi:SDR family NAD(P)-dependent oxidoreductase [Streptomyces sp. NPDC003077]|uniref:SDR family NAD(P)-dependent oxidoreductase n=1 Tax=Streptomyces sp. NPDC003077 TaxID=3154443 RepID=UPI0033A99ED7
MPGSSPLPSGNGAGRVHQPVVLVTGASSGIGSAVAARLAAEGRWRLLLSGRDEGRLTEIATVTSGTALPADLATEDGCERLAERAIGLHDRVDVLVASAGVGGAGPFADMPPAAIDNLLTVNLSAMLRLVRLLLPGMVARGRGHVVMIGSIAGRLGVRQEAVYAASKGALATFAESLRYELAGTGVRVTMVIPGVVDTPFFDRRGVPYRRSWPRPVPAERVAEAVCQALARGCDDVFVPPWLALPVRLYGAMPGLFRKLATRLG